MNPNVRNHFTSFLQNVLVNLLLTIGCPQFEILKPLELEALSQDRIDLKFGFSMNLGEG